MFTHCGLKRLYFSTSLRLKADKPVLDVKMEAVDKQSADRFGQEDQEG